MSFPPRVFTPASTAELAEWLRARPGRLRLCGSRSRQHRLPPAGNAAEVVTSQLARIERIDAPDQTCTVEAGVLRSTLDAELAPRGLQLPCPGAGTLGGLFASDALGAATATGASPRTLLLGMQGLLADGTTFRSGARVVKSVAGFDVHKLLVGSEGRLFVATHLHLRLQPRPRCEQWFRRDGLEAAPAFHLFSALRRLPVPPAAIQLVHTATACSITGRISGRPDFVRDTLRRHELPDADVQWLDHLSAPPHGEVLSGFALASQLGPIAAACAADATLLMHGGGRFEVTSASATASDQFLRRMHELSVPTCVVQGDPGRRRVGTALDPGARHLADQLKQALDPDGMLV